MNTESVVLVVSKLEELIVGVGGKIEAVYPYLVKQALIAGYLSLFGICLGVVFILSALTILFSNKPKFQDDYPTGYGVAIMGFVFMGLVFLIASTVGNITFIAIFNPDFYAIKLLMGMLR
jgi:hypothetical protein